MPWGGKVTDKTRGPPRHVIYRAHFPSAIGLDAWQKHKRRRHEQTATLRQGNIECNPTLLHPEARGKGRGADIHVVWSYELWLIHAAQRRILPACLHEVLGELRVLLLGSY